PDLRPSGGDGRLPAARGWRVGRAGHGSPRRLDRGDVPRREPPPGLPLQRADHAPAVRPAPYAGLGTTGPRRNRPRLDAGPCLPGRDLAGPAARSPARQAAPAPGGARRLPTDPARTETDGGCLSHEAVGGPLYLQRGALPARATDEHRRPGAAPR